VATTAAPIALVRWLAGLGLLQAAEFWSRGDADVSAASALIAADAASETLLSLLGEASSRQVKPLPSREELIQRAQEVLIGAGASIAPSILTDLRSTHALRNNVVHHGARAGNADTVRACAVARGLLDLMPVVHPATTSLPAGAGVASAVAGVLRLSDVSDELRRGDQEVIAGDAGKVADAACIALGRLLHFTTPPLRLKSRQHLFGARADPRDQFGSQVIKDIDQVRGQVDELRPWIVGQALGLSPAEYARVSDITGYYTLYATWPTPTDDVSRSTPPSMADARWALERVAEMTFRLWSSGAISERVDRVFERMPDALARRRSETAERDAPASAQPEHSA
jgi:hypothetical protein